ncbi:hypothetical protein MRX96_030352 [Rhipicephalus microplus]
MPALRHFHLAPSLCRQLFPNLPAVHRPLCHLLALWQTSPPEPHVAAQQPAFGIGATPNTCFWCPQPSQACCRTCSSTHGHQHDKWLWYATANA